MPENTKSNSPQMSRVYSKRIGRPPNPAEPGAAVPLHQMEPRDRQAKIGMPKISFLDPANFYPWETTKVRR